MRKYTEELIKKEMKSIHQVDLQNRLKKLYEEREKLEKNKVIENNKELAEKRKIIEDNIHLSIKVYEENLPQEVVERAKRSGGVYKTSKDIDNSVKKELESINEEIER